MNWLSFLIGVIVGWALEWVIDLLFWRRRGRAPGEAGSTLQARLTKAETENRELEAQLNYYRGQEKRLADCEASLQAKEAELHSLSQQIATAESQVRTLETQLAEARRSAVETVTRAAPGIPLEEVVEPDDLRKIEGIGPKIARILNAQGITTFAQLAATDAHRLKQIMAAAGPRFQLADPTNWPAQAQLAAEGDWEGLKKLQDELVGGRNRHNPL
jgi:predicted flap endonuclease-1-like 5' DNA nuclease